MRKMLFRVTTFLLLLCVALQPLCVRAEQACSLELEYSKDDAGFSGLEIRIYRVADLSGSGEYALCAPFDDLPVKIQGITSQKEWRDAADTLAAYAISGNMEPRQTGVTDSGGRVLFSQLDWGIYLVLGTEAKRDGCVYRFENFCIFLPTPGTDGSWEHAVRAKPKCTVTQEPEEPGLCSYQVVKLWKDTGLRALRPEYITVDILQNGILRETVKLSADNGWCYSWTAPEDGSLWTVVERDVPDAYTVVITSSGTTFTLTNSRPAPGVDPPTTGDTFPLKRYLTVMAVSGILLALVGTVYKRKRG